MAVPAGNRWQQIESIFYAALEVAPQERERFLENACRGDAGLRTEVQSLLDASQHNLDFLQRSVQEAAQDAARDLNSEADVADRLIGEYRLISVLGEGGMGRVYLAERADEMYRQRVAIKLMHASFAQKQRMLLRFAAERQILADLNHPNIARLVDGGVHNGVPYLVMEYADGVFIDEYCRKNHLTIAARLRLFLTVCEAVEYAHKNLVVHRDIKPGNIMVTSEGVPKLLDFGIAKLLAADGSEAARTRSTELMMTPEYASPEQVRGESVTTATDVYALGVLLYELLAGKRPFHFDTTSPIEIARAVCEQMPTLPSTVAKANPDVAPPDAVRKLRGDLDNVILMAMRKEPARRYVSVGQMADDVRAFLDGYPVRARTGAWGYRSAKFIQRHKTVLIATAAMVLALIAFSIGMGVLARRANRERQNAEREAQFLNSIFQATTPEEAKGKSISGPELLDNGAKRVEIEFAGEPELQARLLDNIGRAYASMGFYQKSEALLQRAYELRRRLLGDSNLDTAASLSGLATAIRLQSDYKRAEPLFREVLAIRMRKVDPDDPLVAESMANLADCLYGEDKDQEAESLLRQALVIDKKDGRRSDLADADNYLALVVERKGDFTEAANLLRDSTEIYKTIDGADSPNYATGLHNLAGTLIDAGDLSGAAEVDNHALAIRRKINGPKDPALMYPLNNLGFIYLEEGDWAEAEPYLAENLSVDGWPAQKTVYAAIALNNWAHMLQEKGDYKGAEHNYQEAMAVFEQTSGSMSWGLAKVLANLGMLRADEGNYVDAEKYEHGALEMRRKLGGDESPDLASSLINLAVVASLQHGPAEAEQLLRQALEIRNKELKAGHPAIISVETRLGEVLLDEGKAAEAETLLRQAVAETHAVPFPLPGWQMAEPEIALGAALADEGKTTEAGPLLAKAEFRLKNYPEAAVRKQILARAEEAEKKVHPVSVGRPQ